MSSSLNKIYDHAPIWFQNVMSNVYGVKVYHQRYGRVYREYKRELERCEKLPREAQRAIQLEKLRTLIAYAIEHSPFYRELYGDLEPEDIQTLADFAQLPSVTKEMFRQNINRIITIPRKGAIEWHTGGTTGKSLIGLRTIDDMQQRMATLDHFKERHGFVNRKMRRASFNARYVVPPGYAGKVFWRDNWSVRQRVYSSFYLTEENLLYYVENLQKFRPQSIDGHPSRIYEVASFIERNGIKLNFQPIAVFPTAETLTPQYRQTIESVFNCPVRDQYASSEGAPFVTECPHGKLHYDVFSGVIEPYSIDSDEILITSFTSYGTPLIRYAVGDCMVFATEDEMCTCGNNTPLIRSIQGRLGNYLLTANGSKVMEANLGGALKYLPNSAIQAQFVQEAIGEVLVKIVVDKALFVATDIASVLNELRHKFGEGTDFTIEYVDEIPCEKNGKQRLVVNNIRNI